MRVVVTTAALAAMSLATTARAQRYAAPLTDGIDIPGTPISGELDARTVAYNPGGLPLLRGIELSLALDQQDLDVATSSGAGFGAYLAEAVGGDVLPRIATGLALEWLRPPRSELSPDPGEPFRFTMATAVGLGKNAGFGFSWHHFHDTDGVLSGVNSFDLGLSARFGSYLSAGATLRDLDTSPIAGVQIQRRYALEFTGRPLGTDRVEIAVGGSLGEIHDDTSGWVRAQVRVTRGLALMADFEDRELQEIDVTPAGTIASMPREYRATIGFDISLGNAGIAASATGLHGASGNHALGGTIVARLASTPPASILPPSEHYERVELTADLDVRELTQLVLRLRRIGRDDSARGVLVVLDGSEAGWAALQEVRDELLALRRGGKKVFAYFVWGTSRDYFVASAADKIYIDPAGGLRVVGMAAQSFYFRGAFDLVGVVPQFEKIAEYKSAPEQLTDRGPTPIAEQMRDTMVDSIYAQWLAAVAAGRHMTVDEVRAIAEHGPYTAGDLARTGTGAAKLVDAVAPPDTVAELIAHDGGDYGISSPSETRPERWQRPEIAVIYVNGDITDGESKSVPVLGQSLSGGETVVSALAAARADSSVRAVVLRIDSPGGSALASELISREVFATRKVKPVICSMSNYAASGGYFVAAGCDAIFAEPMTITGSIGIFSGKFDVSGLAKKLGVDVNVYRHGEHADAESMFRPFTDEERAALMAQLQYGYSRFVGAVAEGRNMTKEQVDALGRGHVYTGADAKPIKLVDTFGGIGDAIDEAKRRIGLDPREQVDVLELPRPPRSIIGALAKLVGATHADAGAQSVLDSLPVLRELLRDLPASVWVEPNAPQARLPFELDVK